MPKHWQALAMFSFSFSPKGELLSVQDNFQSAGPGMTLKGEKQVPDSCESNPCSKGGISEVIKKF
jgi:hypothetical protein